MAVREHQGALIHDRCARRHSRAGSARRALRSGVTLRRPRALPFSRRWTSYPAKKGSELVQIGLIKPNARCLCELHANGRATPGVPARDGRLLPRHKKSPFAGTFKKPSDGLEPSTPSLPSSKEAGNAGKRGKPRARKPRKRRKRPKTTDREWTRVPAVVFPQCSLAQRSRTSEAHDSRPSTVGCRVGRSDGDRARAAAARDRHCDPPPMLRALLGLLEPDGRIE